MNLSKKILLGTSISVIALSLAIAVSAETINSTTTRVQIRERASSTRALKNASAIQKAIADADKMINGRINSLNNLLTKIQSTKNISDADKAMIASTTQNEIATMTALKSKIDADTSTTTIRADLKSITADYRVYALVEPQIRILAAADKINQISSLMTATESKLQTRITALQSAGKDVTSLNSMISDMTAKITDAGTQASAAVSKTATLVPDQGNKTIADANLAALKIARADIKTGNSDLQTAKKDAENILKGVRKLTPRNGMTATTTASSTAQ